jgi:Lar family restriction alleviation protein
MNELKPCPFCDGRTTVKTRYVGYGSLGLGSHDEYRVVCKECRASSDEYKSEAKAIAAWNRRAEQNNTPLALDEIISKCTPKAAELLKNGLLGAVKVCAVEEITPKTNADRKELTGSDNP